MFSFLSRKERWFVSHSYEDELYLAYLREALPKRVVPVIFPPIDVPVTEFVSDRLLDAVEDCKCLVFMDTAASKMPSGSRWKLNTLRDRSERLLIRPKPSTNLRRCISAA